MSQGYSSHWPRLAALLLILSVAAGLRLAQLPALPLGLHYDEAANGILAAEIARGVESPLFISAYTGKEVLFFYWAAAWMRALGQTVLALRLTAAVAGTCTVAAAAWSAYELLHERRGAFWIAALTAAFLATSLWHVILSRYGFRAITQPLLQALTIGALWRGLRLERKGWLALAGFLAGATLYTYLAARAFPLPMGVALLTLVLAERGRRWARLKQIAVFALAAAATVAPLAVYFINHPAALTTRVDQVAAHSWAEAWAGLRACLAMFFIKGDPYIRFNIPGRPLFDPIIAAFFLLGILLTLIGRSPKRETTPLPSWSLASRAFLLVLLPVMLLPSALATGEITPSNLRTVGLLPFIYIFPALAVVSIMRAARPKLQMDFCGLGATVLILAILTPLAATAYGQWATSTGLYTAADGDLVDVAEYLNGMDLKGVTPYVASIHYRHPTVAFLADDYPAIRWLTGGETLVFPATGEGLLILPRSAEGGRVWIEERLGTPSRLPTPSGPDGRPAFHAYRIPAGEFPAPTHPLHADFGHAVVLEGYDLLTPPRSGEQVEVVLYWRVAAPVTPGDLLPIARLTDAWGSVWGEARPFHYPAEQWAPGEVVLDHLSVPVAPGAPPGDYSLQVGFYAASTATSLPLVDASGAYAGSTVQLPLRLERALRPPKPADLPIRARIDQTGIAGPTLLGANLDTGAARPGEPIYLTLFWQANDSPQADFTVCLRLGEDDLYTGAPVHGTYPTTEWTAGEVIADRYAPRLGRTFPPGTYPIQLLLTDEAGDIAMGPLTLGQVTVAEIERAFAPPPGIHPIEIPLGREVELVGYALEPETLAPGEQVTLTLYWQALTEMDTSYTVFVHLLRPEGGIAAQHDGIPVNGTYPTPLWMAGEVVADPHVLDLPGDLPPGTYTLEVGLYVQETGARLAVPGSADGAIRLPVTLYPR